MPVKQIEHAIQQARLGSHAYASDWLRILDNWLTDHRAGVGEGLPATSDQAENLMRRLREALAVDPRPSFPEGSTAAL
jgi:hypothetical protein